MKKVILRNSFHNSEATIISDKNTPSEAWDELYELAAGGDKPSLAKFRRISKILCGVYDCQCGIVRS